jgi:hypothetical protein
LILPLAEALEEASLHWLTLDWNLYLLGRWTKVSYCFSSTILLFKLWTSAVSLLFEEKNCCLLLLNSDSSYLTSSSSALVLFLLEEVFIKKADRPFSATIKVRDLGPYC